MWLLQKVFADSYTIAMNYIGESELATWFDQLFVLRVISGQDNRLAKWVQNKVGIT